MKDTENLKKKYTDIKEKNESNATKAEEKLKIPRTTVEMLEQTLQIA